MENNKNVVVKKACHSRTFLSGIFHVLSCNNKENTLSINDRYVEDPRLQASGMTPLFNNGGFTLIELLVVVLIIGILAAVAVPQYKKAVAKARTAEALAMLKSLVNAEEAYYLANGEYTSDISKLDVNVSENQIIAKYSNADPNKFNTYMYACRDRSCSANICNADAPLLEFFFAHAPSNAKGKEIFYCVPYTWTSGCGTKTNIAEGICQSLNAGGDTLVSTWTAGDKNYSTTYYQIN